MFKKKDWMGEEIVYLNLEDESWFAVAPLLKALDFRNDNYGRALAAHIDPKNVLKLSKDGLFECHVDCEDREKPTMKQKMPVLETGISVVRNSRSRLKMMVSYLYLYKSRSRLFFFSTI